MSALLQSPATGEASAVADERPCPECMKAFVPVQASQLFCCPDHRDAWNNRVTTRGRVIAGLAIVARITRDGSRRARGCSDVDLVYAAKASHDLSYLIRGYLREDRAANDGKGRMSWPEWNRRRYQCGFDPL